MISDDTKDEVMRILVDERHDWMRCPDADNTLRELDLAIESLKQGGVRLAAKILRSMQDQNQEAAGRTLPKASPFDSDYARELIEASSALARAQNNAIDRLLPLLEKELN